MNTYRILRRDRRERDRRHGGTGRLFARGSVLAHGSENPVTHGTHCMGQVEWVGRWKFLTGWTTVVVRAAR